MNTLVLVDLRRAISAATRGERFAFGGIPDIPVDVLRRAERLYRRFARDPFDYLYRWHLHTTEKQHAHQA